MNVGDRFFATRLLAISLGTVSMAAGAGSVYRWKAADGTITYSQEAPDHGARDVRRIDVRSLSPEQVRAARLLLRSDAQRADEIAQRREQALTDADRE